MLKQRQIKPFFRPVSKGPSSKALRPVAPPPPPPPLISEEEAVEFMVQLTPANYRKVSCMIGAQLQQMVLPWDVTGPAWALARRKVISELLAREVDLDTVFFEE